MQLEKVSFQYNKYQRQKNNCL